MMRITSHVRASAKNVSETLLRLDRLQTSPIDLNRPAMELLRSVQVRIEGSSQAANEKPRVVCQIERGTVTVDDAVGNQLVQTRRRIQYRFGCGPESCANLIEIDAEVA